MQKYYSERKKNYQFFNNYLLFNNSHLLKIKNIKIILKSKNFKKNLLYKYINIYNKISKKKIIIQNFKYNKILKKNFFELMKSCNIYEFQIFLKIIKNINKNITKNKKKWFINVSGIYLNNFLYHSNQFTIKINFSKKIIKSTSYNYLIKILN